MLSLYLSIAIRTYYTVFPCVSIKAFHSHSHSHSHHLLPTVSTILLGTLLKWDGVEHFNVVSEHLNELTSITAWLPSPLNTDIPSHNNVAFSSYIEYLCQFIVSL